MAVPGRVVAAALLLSLDPPPWFLRHSRAVAEIAGWLARAAAANGASVDRRLVEAAALLHDVDKLPAVRGSGTLRDEAHGAGSAAWLAARGHAELAEAVRAHPVVRLADDRWWRRFRSEAPLEVRIVAYADKRAGQRLESLDERFASWRRRYPPGTRVDGAAGWDEATVALVHARARELETDVCRAAGVRPEAIGRLGWTGRALAAARGAAIDGPIGDAADGGRRR